jgi:hypothetical protein
MKKIIMTPKKGGKTIVMTPKKKPTLIFTKKKDTRPLKRYPTRVA